MSETPIAPKTKPTPVMKATSTAKRSELPLPSEGSLCRKVWDAQEKLIEECKGTAFGAVRELSGKIMPATIRTQRPRHETHHATN